MTRAPTCSPSTSTTSAGSSQWTESRRRSKPYVRRASGWWASVIERIRASSLRARLIAALVLTTSGILIASFIALHERAGADLDDRVDDGLQQDLDEFR